MPNVANTKAAWSERVRRLQWHRFERHLEPERDALAGYCRRLTGNADDAADLTHDTLLLGFAWLGRLWTHIEHPRAFLFRAARNRWIDLMRREHTRPDASYPMDDPATNLELEEVLDRAVEVLSPAEYDAWLACRVFGSTSKEAATALGRSPDAVKMASSRATRRLRDAFS